MSFSKIKRSTFIYVLASLLCPLSSALALSTTAAPVPPSYAQSYNALNQAVGNFQTSLDNRNQSMSSTTFSSKLMCADASQGPALLKPSTLKLVASELAQYKKMGVQGVVIHTGFPILTPQFFNAEKGNIGSFEQYMSFYQQVFQLCHAAGMKVLVESHPEFPFGGNAFSVLVQKYCQSLSSSQYQAQVAQNNTCLAGLGPDIISIVSEPNTDFAWTNQQLYKSPTELAAFVQASVSAVRALNTTKVVLAAGAPNWQSDSVQFDSLFGQISGLDAIDIHIYFSGNNELEFATTLADNAKSMGKKIVVSECWLTKVGTGTPPVNALPNNTQANTAMAVNAFSFWQPLDLAMIYSFFKWCNVENPQFFAFFYTQLLFANLDYNTYGSQSNASNVQTEELLAHQNLNAGILTPVGAYYSSLLNAPRQNHY